MLRADPAGIAYACAAVVFATVAAVTWRRRVANPAVAASLVAVMLGAGWWSLTDAVAASAVDETLSAVAYLAVFPGLTATVVAFACLAGAIARPPWRPSRRLVVALLVEPALVSVLAATNPLHGLVYRGRGAAELTGAADWEYGPVFWVHSTYSYTALLAGMVLVAHAWWTAPPAFRSQRLSMLVAVLVPAAVNVANLVGAIPVEVDPTPVGLAVTGVIVSYAIFRQDLFTFTPVTRALILEQISDAIIAVSPVGRVIDVNPAAVRLVRRLRPAGSRSSGRSRANCSATRSPRPGRNPRRSGSPSTARPRSCTCAAPRSWTGRGACWAACSSRVTSPRSRRRAVGSRRRTPSSPTSSPPSSGCAPTSRTRPAATSSPACTTGGT
ncbi:histidine kinase N-terminal 7TM domain-containing protein [Cellulomonas sp. ATA003]|uniref:histidine kinase N-terminal 7TM domain-containing protein n=1 Tax=Cellulomonas sp. ATA003 TaxID=3073064 RepID=UPI002872F2F2|nr:histidine kinase N-terminal 7TM domain-containing protein [Cellulomonas sp. ATA003]WNB85065.1 histidine kinase N-terminal 7TM domain-containing protein [Cellulomonas sp. ATA003]